jgi:transposase
MHTTSDIQLPAAGRKRGRYSDAFKAQLVAACQEPGVSTAAIALANGLNANLLRRWVSEQRQTPDGIACSPDIRQGFVQLTPPPSPRPVPWVESVGADRMHLHLSRGDLQVHLSIPAHQHAPCAALLKLLLS